MDHTERYKRQIAIPQIGPEGQQKLAESTVVVAGAGGLGSPTLTYLTLAGVGHIRVIDCDDVSLSNLNRQFLHTEQDLKKRKTTSALESLTTWNSTVDIEVRDEWITAESVERLIGKPDVVVDCLDNITARLLVGEYCLKQNIPLVEGGIRGFYGWVTSICRESACLRCMGYHEGMEQNGIPVLGATAGVIGSLQATECIKLLLGIGEPLFGRMLQYDGLSGSMDELPVLIDPDCKAHAAIIETKE